MTPDIVSRIEKDFESPDKVLEILESLESVNRDPVSDRTYRSIVFLSAGNMDKLDHYIELAFQDYRDLYWQAEYEDPDVRKYDFSKPFEEQGL